MSVTHHGTATSLTTGVPSVNEVPEMPENLEHEV